MHIGERRMNDLISRQAAIDALDEYFGRIGKLKRRGLTKGERAIALDVVGAIRTLPSAQQWIPIKTRPMTDEEREHFADVFGYTPEGDDAVMFDCKMPYDKQRIWICTRCGNVFDDVCEDDDGFVGLEGNGDWDGIVAWMPMHVPEPYKGEQK